jgi:hypothetical protein
MFGALTQLRNSIDENAHNPSKSDKATVSDTHYGTAAEVNQ